MDGAWRVPASARNIARDKNTTMGGHSVNLVGKLQPGDSRAIVGVEGDLWLAGRPADNIAPLSALPGIAASLKGVVGVISAATGVYQYQYGHSENRPQAPGSDAIAVSWFVIH